MLRVLRDRGRNGQGLDGAGIPGHGWREGPRSGQEARGAGQSARRRRGVWPRGIGRSIHAPDRRWLDGPWSLGVLARTPGARACRCPRSGGIPPPRPGGSSRTTALRPRKTGPRRGARRLDAGTGPRLGMPCRRSRQQDPQQARHPPRPHPEGTLQPSGHAPRDRPRRGASRRPDSRGAVPGPGGQRVTARGA